MSGFLTNTGVISAVSVTFKMAFSSTAIASVLGIILGMLLERASFPGKRLVVRLNRTLMGVPPVVVGLVVYMLTMRKGPLGMFELLFTVKGMVLAQVLIITPVICGMTYTSLVSKAPAIRVFAKTMGADYFQTQCLIMRELKNELYFAVVTGFGRAISEVGAVMLVGGNIKGHTRTMTTAISLLKSQGIFTEGIVLGVILLVMAFILQSLADFFRREERENDNI
ncbi:MAG: ABC transporter permease subunit [Clostridia bacterium]|nr:ABC transporter permease [Anaerostipes sp.]NCB94398.1 ABC transporter permease subunit [Clostridia bacterium]NCC44294.1 ABC transporter permease subunit [Clostridia bacterium]